MIQSNTELIEMADFVIKRVKENIYQKIVVKTIKSFFLETSSTIITESITEAEGFGEPMKKESRYTTNEKIWFQSATKINHLVFMYTSTENPANNYSKIEDILNGDEVLRKLDTVVGGEMIDINKMYTSPKFSKEFKNQMKRNLAEKTGITKEEIINEVSNKMFPISLDKIWIKDKKMLYVGKADVGNLEADVLEIEINTAERRKYFFDSNTHLLVMITEEFYENGKSAKTTSYFSDYQSINELIIAKKIITERETFDLREMEIKGKNIKMSNQSKVVTETVIEEFSINPQFAPEKFVIKEK